MNKLCPLGHFSCTLTPAIAYRVMDIEVVRAVVEHFHLTQTAEAEMRRGALCMLPAKVISGEVDASESDIEIGVQEI